MKKVILGIMLLLITFTMIGCPCLQDEAHGNAHMRVVKRNLNEIHRFIDRNVFNYDWESPYDN